MGLEHIQVHANLGRTWKKFPNCPRQVPIGLLSEEWAMHNHSQDLKELHRRGGLSPVEMIMNIEGKRANEIDLSDEGSAVKKLIQYIEAYNAKTSASIDNP